MVSRLSSFHPTGQQRVCNSASMPCGSSLGFRLLEGVRGKYAQNPCKFYNNSDIPSTKPLNPELGALNLLTKSPSSGTRLRVSEALGREYSRNSKALMCVEFWAVEPSAIPYSCIELLEPKRKYNLNLNWRL